MPTLNAGFAIALAVAMHVAWNLLARQQPKDAYALWWVLLGHIVVLGPWGMFHFLSQVHWSMGLAALLAISSLALATYFLALERAYSHASVALVYPLARSSPVLIALWSSLLFFESLHLAVWLGIVVSIGGLVLMAGTGRQASDGRAIPWALLAMFATSIYSLSDRAALAQLSGFGPIVGFITVGYLVSWIALSLSLRARLGQWTPSNRIGIGTMLFGGVCIGLSYALVIHAMRELPAAEVVAYSNAGIVVASLVSIFIFKEKAFWKRRLAGALVICAGLLIMAFGKN